MTKAIIVAVFAIAISFFTVAGVVDAQTATPTPTTTVTPGAPSTGFGM
ncbi:MAG: hypothetical protein KA035_03235 [Candidatus Levybacteria bacterium]|nr:hypothetical protein [Candidatus Levybacteria bacterium]